MKNGNLRTLLRNDVPKPRYLRLQWIKTALEAIDYIHSKDAVQGDIGEERSLVRPEVRYEKQGNELIRVSKATDVFAIGSLIYEIVTGKPPYNELEDDDVETLFRREGSPPTSDVYVGAIIRGCWVGKHETANQALDGVLACEIEEGEGLKVEREDITKFAYEALRWLISIWKVCVD